MELVLSIIIIVQTYVGVRFYIKTQKDFDNINKQVADIHRHDVGEIYKHVEKIEGDLNKNILETINELKVEPNNSFKELNHTILNQKLETEQDLKNYLNSWRTSSEFKTMLHLIKKTEDKNTSQNVY